MIKIGDQSVVDCLLAYEREVVELLIDFVLSMFTEILFRSGDYDDGYVRAMNSFDEWAIVVHRDDVLLSPVVRSVEAPDYGYVVLFSHLVDIVLEELGSLPAEAPDGVDEREWSLQALGRDFDRLSEGMDGYFLSYEDFDAGQFIGSFLNYKQHEEPYWYHDRTSFTYQLPGRERKTDFKSETMLLYVVFSKPCRDRLVAMGEDACVKYLHDLFGLVGDEEVD